MANIRNVKSVRRKLRAGDWVVVRTKEEILATLDDNGRFEGLPFQPEMFSFCGKRMRVAKTAHKTCDTIHKTGGRRMLHAVHLEGSRCDGAFHGGCQANCLFFWKEAWLRPADATTSTHTPARAGGTEAMVLQATRSPDDWDGSDPTWVCQATMLYEATTLLKWWDVRQYVRDITSGNHSTAHMARILLAAAYRNFVNLGRGYRLKIALYNWFQRLRGGAPYPMFEGTISRGEKTPVEHLELKPGEWVEIKSFREIAPTITEDGFNRGMRYDVEMVRFSGGRYRVQARVDRIINEQTGKMMRMKTPCVQLENVYCQAECSAKRLGCPRAISSYWREIWLRRAEPPTSHRAS